MITSLEELINRYIHLDHRTNHKLEKLDGKIVVIYFKEFDKSLYITFVKNRIKLSNNALNPVDLTLKASFFTFINLISNPHSGGLDAIGDISLAQELRMLFSSLEIDWEEQLSNILGDVLAHKIGNLSKSIHQWGVGTISALQNNATDYLQTEKDLLPCDEELTNLYLDIDNLRMDTDRLELKWLELKKQYEIL